MSYIFVSLGYSLVTTSLFFMHFPSHRFIHLPFESTILRNVTINSVPASHMFLSFVSFLSPSLLLIINFHVLVSSLFSFTMYKDLFIRLFFEVTLCAIFLAIPSFFFFFLDAVILVLPFPARVISVSGDSIIEPNEVELVWPK